MESSSREICPGCFHALDLKGPTKLPSPHSASVKQEASVSLVLWLTSVDLVEHPKITISCCACFVLCICSCTIGMFVRHTVQSRNTRPLHPKFLTQSDLKVAFSARTLPRKSERSAQGPRPPGLRRSPARPGPDQHRTCSSQHGTKSHHCCCRAGAPPHPTLQLADT